MLSRVFKKIQEAAKMDRVIIAYPSCLLGKPKDWPKNVNLTGALNLKRNIQASRSNYPIVYVSFGSAWNALLLEDKLKLARVVLGAASIMTNIQFLFQVPKELLVNLLAPKNLLFLTDHVDHENLFASCWGLVCHGGIGTISAALSSGCPVLVVGAVFVFLHFLILFRCLFQTLICPSMQSVWHGQGWGLNPCYFSNFLKKA